MLLRGVRCLPTTLQRGSRGMRLTTLPPLRRPLARGGRGRRRESGRLHVALFYVSLVLALFGLGNLNIVLPLVSGSRFVARGVQVCWIISGRLLLDGCRIQLVTCFVSGYKFMSVYGGFWSISSAALVVDIGSGMCWLVLLVTIYLELCSSMSISVAIPQEQFLDRLLRLKPVAIPQVQSLVKVYMPVVVSGADGQTVQNTRGDSTGAVLGQVVHARFCVWCRWPDSAQNCGFSAAAFHRLSSTSRSWCTRRFPWSCCSADHGVPTVAFLVRGDRCPWYAGRAGTSLQRHVPSTLQFINKVVIFHFVAQRLFPMV